MLVGYVLATFEDGRKLVRKRFPVFRTKSGLESLRGPVSNTYEWIQDGDGWILLRKKLRSAAGTRVKLHLRFYNPESFADIERGLAEYGERRGLSLRSWALQL